MFNKGEGIVLKTTDYGETNKIVTLLTKNWGKIGVMARGAKKPNSKLSSCSQIFTIGSYLFQLNRGLGMLHQGETIQSMRGLREDIYLTAFAAYIVELAEKGTDERKPIPKLYEQLALSLQYLQEAYDPDIIKTIFEIKMLPILGLKPVFHECVHCKAKEGIFSFSVRENGFLCHRCFEIDPYRIPISPSTTRLLSQFARINLEQIGSIQVKDQTKKELDVVMEQYYDTYSGLFLKSKGVLKQIKQVWKPAQD
ncbi:DNA replication and repair protein RecO [Bacillus oleivorans]|uniref:DNA repair protein RecO n=1 Tax=Bacillus oleivorans TaxID=1448271 RepID=A0A285CJV9_9BACI|nr:DNA repair protein RecO [Bacillus oleivorans]SNX67881.1 DNA replication and repair protein RecO [Bacillus oleivorans]